MKHISSLFLAVAIAGCASTAIAPSELKVPAQLDEFYLPSSIQYKIIGNAIQLDIERGILPGVYRADRADVAGTFYVCQGRCVWERNVGHSVTYLFPGGVYVPNDTNLTPRLYTIFAPSMQTTNDLNAYIDQRAQASIVQGGSVGANVVGGVIAGAIVQAAIDADVGKHNVLPDSSDQEFIRSIRTALASRTAPSPLGSQSGTKAK